jgi:hypothetical protein
MAILFAIDDQDANRAILAQKHKKGRLISCTSGAEINGNGVIANSQPIGKSALCSKW